MAEDTATAGQPTAVETESTGAEQDSSTPYVPSFMRPDEGEAEPEAEETPETQTAEGEAEPEGEQETGAAEPETAEEQPEESVDDFIATLTLKDRAYYAKRYPTGWKALTDPSQPDDIRALVLDKIKSDFEIKEHRSQQEPTLAEEEEEAAPTDAPDAAEQRKQYYAQIDDIVAKQVDPQAVNELGSNLLSAMGVDLKSEDPDIQAIVKNAPRVGQVLAKGALDLMSTTLPGILMSRLELAMPGISRMYEDNLCATKWEEQRGRTVKGPDGNPTKPYAKLPAFGSQQWGTAVDSVLKEMPELREMFSELPPHERIAKQYAVAARIMSGQQVSPAVIAQAVETGKKLARTAVTRRAAGKVLGAGKTSGEVRVGGTGNEDLFGPGIAEYKRRGGG